MLIYSISLLVVYLVTWWVLSIFLFHPLEEEREENIQYNSQKIVSDIREIREGYDNIAFRLSNNRMIYKSLSDRCKNYEDVWEALTIIKYTLNEDMARSSIIRRLEVYQQGSDIGQDGRFVYSDDFDISKLDINWVNETIDGALLLCKYQEIASLYNGVDAYIKIAIDSQEAFEGALGLEGDLSGVVYLTNEDDIVISSSDASSLGSPISKVLPETYTDFVEGQIIEYNEILRLKSPVYENWNLWLLVPSNQISDKVDYSKTIVGSILFGYGICSGIALSLLLSKVFGRLNKLGENMEQIQGDISYIAIPEENRDEVTVLEHKYNSMLRKLDKTVEEMAEVKSQKKKFEFKSLESQINPHFLYNTLGVMRWEALECQNQKLVEMIDDLTIFYRLSLNKGKGLLSVEQEFKLVKAYINIQQMRWDNVVAVNYSIDSQVKELVIPKMILQPLVENIWLHGNITAEGNRKIEIAARSKNSHLELRIWDNGDGISKDIIDKFKANEEYEGDSIGIGIRFIKNILKYYYGDNFVYEVTSDKHEGTLILIEVPEEIGVIS